MFDGKRGPDMTLAPAPEGTRATATFRDCASALTWRIWRQHRVGLVIVPFGYLALIVGLIALAVTDQKIINGARRMSVIGTSQFGAPPGHLAIAVGLAVLFIPSLVALQVAAMVANGVRSMIGSERSMGTMELLCASSVSRPVLLASVLTAPALIALLEWLLLIVPLTIATTVIVATQHLHVTNVGSSIVPLLVAPLPLSLLGGVLVLAVAVWKPRLTDQTVGPASSVLRLLGTGPAMVVLLLVLFRSSWGVVHVVAVAAVIALVGCIAVVTLLWRVFAPERVLTP
jgi:hypothetical protein